MNDRDVVASRSLGRSDGVADGHVVPFYLQDCKRRLAVARVDGRLFAFDDLCTCGPHPCPLSGGLLTRTTIMCQCHGSEFDIATGAIAKGLAARPLQVYPVEEAEGLIRVGL